VAHYEIQVSVKELLEILYHPKDLGVSFIPATRGQEGTEGHQLLTSQRPPGYRREVPIEFEYEWEDCRLVVRGRFDGQMETADGIMIEEIKTTYSILSEITPQQYPTHQAQLKLYLYFAMARYPGQQITGRLTYLNLDDLSERSFPLVISFSEAEQFFTMLAKAYLATERKFITWRQIRNDSISRLEFPYHERRAGQDELMELISLALEQERDLFAEAATGIGKTIAVLYPALKRLSESNRYSQIFFLTAKTAGKEILRKTLQTAQNQGLRLRTVFIEAKERVCLSPGSKCRPQGCPYATDYYQKVEAIIPELLPYELITPELVLGYAKDGEVCPYELSLDLALLVDLIVCDYNYVFDPGVYLRRFFLSSRRDFLFLVDEAHNLASRGREMYSATLSQQVLFQLRGELSGINRKLVAACMAVEEFFENWQQEIQKEQLPGFTLSSLPEFLEPSLERLIAVLELTLKQPLPRPVWEKIQEHYFNLTAFTRIAALVNKEYAIYVKLDGEWLILRLFCLNPGPLLRKRLDKARVTVFFSATLSPYDYFREILGGNPDSLNIRLTSPFPQETRLYLHVPGIDTRYRVRQDSAFALTKCIGGLATAHIGNYLVFFPSYAYLQAVMPLVQETLAGKVAIYAQTPSMREAQKQEFLRRISATGTGRSNLGLAVLGGLFGEAVDLPGEALVGVMIVGPGLPVISDEQELIRMYFEERKGQGFLFAYLIPGLIRVIQSAGRVFRTPDDKGVVILVDDRFMDEHYQELLPPDWFAPGRQFSKADYQLVLREFWDQD
jgi:DNA excision repair protein ERCC-2